jgi:hypothetical protein
MGPSASDLRAIPLFRGFADDVLAELGGLFTRVIVDAAVPLFDIGVPLPLFYIIAPLLLVLFHLNLLMKMHDLRVRVRALADRLTNNEMRDLMRRQVTAFDYALLVGRLVNNRAERLLLSIVTDVTVFIMPLALLLFVQLRFLPDHNLAMTWFHRSLVVIDLGLIFYIQHWLGTDGKKTLGAFLLFLLPDFKNLTTLTKAAVRGPGGDSFLKLAATVFYPRGWLALDLLPGCGY